MTSEFMLSKLQDSCLDPGDVDAVDTFDFSGNPSGFKLPYYFPTGVQHPHMYRIRLQHPAPGQGKYTQPSTDDLVRLGHPPETATMPYLNPHILGGVTWEALGKVRNKKLMIVEGELKAACAGKLLKRAAIGIPGCEGGVRRNPAGVAHVHPLIRGLIQPGDEITVVLDGDLLTNPDVNRAAGTLKRALGRLGVRPVFVLLPPPQPGCGAGLDDWLKGQAQTDIIGAFERLPRTPGEDFDEDWASVADAFGLAVGKTGIAAPTASNIQILLEKHERYQGRYYYDVMRGNLYRNDPAGPRPFVDSFGVDEQVWLQRRIGMSVTKTAALDGLRWMADQQKFRRNTLIESLPAWDAVPRLETMLIDGWGATDSDYIRAVGKNWLVSAMARASDPGCKVDTMLVLIGPQGIYKSKSLEALGGDLYVSTHAQVADKDFVMALHRGWLIDLAELSSMTHSDANHIKGIITTAVDHYRPPYGASVEEKSRHSVMVGTTNEDRFLRDATGNRRFWPVECGNIKMKWITDNREQLLAEAKVKYDAGQDWWTMPASTTAIQNARMEIGPWDAPLQSILSGITVNGRVVTVSGVMYRFVTSEELLESLNIGIERRKSHMYRDLGAAMRRVGGLSWEPWICQQRITLLSGGHVDLSRGYRTTVTGNPMAKVIDMPQRPQPF